MSETLLRVERKTREVERQSGRRRADFLKLGNENSGL